MKPVSQEVKPVLRSVVKPVSVETGFTETGSNGQWSQPPQTEPNRVLRAKRRDERRAGRAKRREERGDWLTLNGPINRKYSFSPHILMVL